MKIIIAGSRNFSDFDLLARYMDSLLIPGNIYYSTGPHTIISGTAKGADKLGERYARSCEYDCRKMPANWDKYGKSAGIIRNTSMADYADIAIVFWDGISKGSEHMIRTMKTLNKPCFVVLYDLK